MKHELREVDLLQAATDDTDAWEKPSMADTENHAEPEVVLVACSWIFIIIIYRVGRPSERNHYDTDEEDEHNDKLDGAYSLFVYQVAQGGGPKRIRLEEDNDESHWDERQVKGEK